MLLSSPSSLVSSRISALAAQLLNHIERNIDKSIQNEFQHFRDSFFRGLLACTLVVFLGVVLEEAESWFPIARPRLDLSRGIFIPSPLIPWRRKLARLGWILIVIGVLGEGIFEEAASEADAALQEFSNTLISTTQQSSDWATDAAATANQRAAEADERASVNEKEAQQLKSENLQLEAIIGPRSLTLDQQKQIADACGRFGGHGVLVVSYGMDGEAAALGGQIISTLQSAHIVVADGRGSITVSGGFDIGVHVRGPEAAHELISVLGDALFRIGKLKVAVNDPLPRMGTMIGGGGQTFAAGTVFVTVMVGVKPLPVLPAPK
jgi:hypothetical protein